MNSQPAFSRSMISSPEYLAVVHLRTEALERSELHPLDPAELA